MKAKFSDGPIGIFDSGVGGLSIWDEVRRRMPGEKLIYFADTARCPYGGRPVSEIHRFSEEIVRFLLSLGCKMIVVACNTATAGAIDRLRAAFDVPFVGVEPAVKAAVKKTSTGHIGVLATESTLASGRYKSLVDRYAGSVRVHYQAGAGLVELVEEGREDSPEAGRILQKYLDAMKAERVDQVILGCTHYPFLRRRIMEIMGPTVAVHDPSEAVARRVEDVLREKGLRSAAKDGEAPLIFFTTSGPGSLKKRVESIVPGGEWKEDQAEGGFHRLELSGGHPGGMEGNRAVPSAVGRPGRK